MTPNPSARPSGIVVGAFDADAVVDVVVAESDTRNLTVFLYDPASQTLMRQRSYAAGTMPATPVAADFDGDAKLDLVVANFAAGAVVFLKGGGDGKFEPPSDPLFGVGAGPAGLAAADINLDGAQDVVVASRGARQTSTGAVTILRGAGNGTFTVVGALDTERGTRGLAIGHIDDDSRYDIVAVNNGSRSFSPFFGDRIFSFVSGEPVTTGVAPTAIAVGDLNNDGAAEVVTADGNADEVSVFVSNGDRSFRARRSVAVSADPDSVAVADVSGDGNADVVAASSQSGDVSVLLGDGRGGLGAARSYVVGEEPLALGLGDFNLDGLPDLVTANATALAVVLNEGGGAFTAVEDLQGQGVPIAVAVGDVDSDAFPDLVVGHEDGAVLLFRARAGGGFHRPDRIMQRGRVLDVEVVDLNDDGVLDVTALDGADATIAVRLGTGGGEFAPVTQTFQAGAEPAAMTSGDFNADGAPDVAIAGGGAQGAVSVLTGVGDGTFESRGSQPVGATPRALATGDFTCDGADDLIVANSASGTVSVVLGDRDDAFALGRTLTDVGVEPGTIVVADFNRDGQPDFALGSRVVPQGGSAVRVFHADPCDATFTNPEDLRFGGGPVASLVARDVYRAPDLEADAADVGIVDLVAADQTSNAVQVFRGASDGSFAAMLNQTVSRMPVAIAAGDFDGDGRYDAATANNDERAHNVSVLTNVGGGDAAPRADGNGDGRVSSADVLALLRELTDGDGQQVEAIGRENPQTRAGVDANGDGLVNKQDIPATTARLFL